MKNLDDFLKPESKLFFGNISDFHLNGFRIDLEEELFGLKVYSEYQIGQLVDDFDNHKFVRVRLNTKFKHSGPIDLFKFLNEGTNRLNKLTESITGGVQ